jgi:predicted metal-dependent peptidase
LKNAVVQGYEQQKKIDGKGSIPADLIQVIEGMIIPKIDIGRYLQETIGRHGERTKYSWKVKNKRNQYREYFPMKKGRRSNQGKVYLLLDTSGSMWNESSGFMKMLGLATKAIDEHRMSATAIMNDAEVAAVFDEYQLREIVANKRLNLYGGGGSDFNPGFKKIGELMLQEGGGSEIPLIFAFTDGEIAIPTSLPYKAEVVWLTNNRRFTPQFGKVINIDNV